jgi:hypothetical protein
MPGVPVPPVVAEATRRSAVAWVQLDGGDHLVWQVWHDGSMYVVSGGIEQELPAMTHCVVAVRSKSRQGDLPVRWVADVVAVPPGSALWDEVVPLLHARRLNPPDGEAQPQRWARESRVQRFSPTGDCL